jgi:hypothetical protein
MAALPAKAPRPGAQSPSPEAVPAPLFGARGALSLSLLQIAAALYLGVVGAALGRSAAPNDAGALAPAAAALALGIGAALSRRALLPEGAGALLRADRGAAGPLTLQLAALGVVFGLAQSLAGLMGGAGPWLTLGWVGAPLYALLFAAPWALLRGRGALFSRPLVAAMLALSAILPALCGMVALALSSPEGFLGDPGRFHHLGISYGQAISIGLGVLFTRLYIADEEAARGRRRSLAAAVLCLVVVPSLGLTALTATAHPALAAALGVITAAGAVFFRAHLIGSGNG